jgi:hypothetical protein
MAGPVGRPRATTPPASAVELPREAPRGAAPGAPPAAVVEPSATLVVAAALAPLRAIAVAPAARFAASCDSSGVGAGGCLTTWTRKIVVPTWWRIRARSWS